MATPTIEFSWRGTFHPSSQGRLKRLASSTIGEFFGHHQDLRSVNLVCLRATRGVERGIKILPRSEKSCGGNALPVLVHLEGTQGLECFMDSNLSSEKLVEIIQSSADPKARRLKKAKPAPLAPESHEEDDTTNSQDLSTEGSTFQKQEAVTPVVVQPEPVKQPPQSHSPKVVLLKSGMWTDETLERLKGTLAYLLYDLKDTDLSSPGATVQLPVSKITQAIKDHMKISGNRTTGSFQGIIGNFYATVISLFAYKGYEDPGGQELYTNWMFDVPLVIDFIGGTDKLSALARERKRENEVREEQQRNLPLPVSALEVKEAAEAEATSDEELVKLALAALASEREAEDGLRIAEENLNAVEARVVELEALLARAHGDRVVALTSVSQAREAVASFKISDEIRSRVVEAKHRTEQAYLRMQALAQELGI